MVGRNIAVLSKIEYYPLQIEYREIINAFGTSNGDDAVDCVWNEYNYQKFSRKKLGKYQTSLITDDDRKLIILRQSSKHLEENFLNNKLKHNASLTLYQKINTKHLRIFWLIKNQNIVMNLTRKVI